MSQIPQTRELEFTYVGDIEIREGRRAIDEDAVKALMASMSEIGLKTPISVRHYEERPAFLPPVENASDAIVLLTGGYRLEAAKRLGWTKIEAFVHSDGDEIDAELWEIAENLHRAELTALERSEQVARWILLTVKQQEVLRQPDAKPQGGRPEGGVRAAARALRLTEPAARRAVKVAKLSPAAKQTARETGLADNGAVLLSAAKETTAEAQVHYLRTEFKKREHDGSVPVSEEEMDQRDFQGLVKVWDAARLGGRELFRAYITSPSKAGIAGHAG